MTSSLIKSTDNDFSKRGGYMFRAYEIVTVVRDNSSTISEKEFWQLDDEYQLLKTVLSAMAAESNPSRTLWDLHCYAQGKSLNHSLLDFFQPAAA